MPSHPRSPQYSQYEAALQNPNVRAFLDAIAKAEGTYRRGEDGYNIVVGHGQFNNGYSDHPRRMVQLNARLRSNAAGRYQFLSTTWDRIARTYGYNDFKPHTQDIAAVSLIAERGALQAVMRGDIQRAAYLCRQEWASLPASEHGQRTVSTNSFMQGFNDALAFIRRGLTTIGNAIGSVFRPPEPQTQAQPQPQPQTSGWRMHRLNNDPPLSTPSTAPSYAPHVMPPRDMRPELRPAPPATPMVPWVNNRAPAIPQQQSNVIMGDSIGSSLKWAYPHIQNVAVPGVSIAAAASQFRHVRPGSVADVVLGSNNGPYSDQENKRQVQAFLRAADQSGVRINNWVLPGNYHGRPAADEGLRRVSNVIAQTIQEYNRAHPDRPPIATVVTRDMGIQKSADGLHLTLRGTQQVRTLIAASTAHPPTGITTTTTTSTWAMHRQPPPRSTA